MREIEARVENERSQVLEQQTVQPLRVAPDRTGRTSDRQRLIEVLALDPQLEFARLVAAVGAILEVGDDHHFYGRRWQGRRRRRCRGRPQGRFPGGRPGRLGGPSTGGGAQQGDGGDADHLMHSW